MTREKIKVFITYSWEEDVKNWVISFAQKLKDEKLDVYIDNDLQFGERLPQFMEKITVSDYVLIICTPTYKNKADSRKGGVGYEGHLISGEILNHSNEHKFIPILRKGTFKESLPNFLAGKNCADLSDNNPNYEVDYQKLIYQICRKKLKTNRQRKNDDSPAEKIISTDVEDNTPIKIIKILIDEVTTPKMDDTRGSALYKIPFQLSRKPSKVWIDVFIQTWNYPPHFTTMHRPRIAMIDEDRLILNGTTIEEVQKYHNDTLKLCIDKANEKEQEFLNETKKQKILEEQRKNQHLANITKIADEIQF